MSLSMTKRLKRIYVEITNVCDGECGFCPKTRRSPEFISPAFFKKILGEIKNHTSHLYFHVMGEPLLHPNIGDFLDFCGENGIVVNLSTNGRAIKAKGGGLLGKPALRQVNFSLHAFEAGKRRSSLKEYLGDIFDFIREGRKNSKTLFCLRLWNYGGGGGSAGKNRYILEHIRDEFKYAGEIEKKCALNNRITIAPNIFLNQAEKFEWPGLDSPGSTETGFCLGLREQAAILVDGTVVPCCLDRDGIMELGNIKNASFKSIIESERAVKIYDGFSRNRAVEELCRKCGYKERFSRKGYTPAIRLPEGLLGP